MRVGCAGCDRMARVPGSCSSVGSAPATFG
jgi:hypothetical protein